MPATLGEAMRRPVVVTILSLLNYLVGAYLFVGSLFGLMALWLGPFAVVFWGVNALFLCLGYGLWRLRNWAWLIQISLSMIYAVGWLVLTIGELREYGFSVDLLLGPGFTILNVVIILYLLQPKVKQVFGASTRRRHDTATAASSPASKAVSEAHHDAA